MTDSPRLSVVYVGHSAQLSGAELALSNLLPALTEIDALVVLAEDGPLVERLRGQGVETVVLPLRSATRELRKDTLSTVRAQLVPALDTLRYAMRLARLLRARRPDLVHTNSLKAHLYGGVAARLAGVPQVWHARDRISEDYLPVRAVQAVRLAVRVLPAAVVANSVSTRQTLRSSRKPTADCRDRQPRRLRRGAAVREAQRQPGPAFHGRDGGAAVTVERPGRVLAGLRGGLPRRRGTGPGGGSGDVRRGRVRHDGGGPGP